MTASAIAVTTPYPLFNDVDGQPLENGRIWVGVAGFPAKTNPKDIFWDEALTIPAAQPVMTRGGYPQWSGAPRRFYVDGDHSILVENKSGAPVYGSTENNIQTFFKVEEQTKTAGVILSLVADKTGTLDASTIINGILADGFPVIVDRGSFRIENQIVLQSGSELRFLNGASFVQPNAINYAEGMLYGLNAANIKIDGATLVGSLVATTPGAAINDAIRIYGCTNVEIRSAKCTGFQGNGIRVSGSSSNVRVYEPECGGNQQNGILVADSSDCRLHDITCYGNGTSSLEHGLYISGITGNGSERMIVSGVSKTYSNSGSGIQLNKLSTDVVIDDVQTFENGTNGINIASDTGATEVSVTLGSVRSFRNVRRGIYVAQGTAAVKFNADKLSAQENGFEGVYLEGLTLGAIIGSTDCSGNGMHGLRIKDSAGTACRDVVIGSARTWDNSQLGDGLYPGLSIEASIRCVIGNVSIRSTGAKKHSYGISVSGASQFNSFASGEIYGSLTADFNDSSTANSSVFGSIITGDNSYPSNSEQSVAASSAVTLSSTPAVALSSSSLPIGRYHGSVYCRLFNTTGTGQVTVEIYAGATKVAESGVIDLQNSVRTSITLPFSFQILSPSVVEVRITATTGAGTAAERRINISRE